MTALRGLLLVACLAICPLLPAAARAEIVMTDAAGREVRLQAPAKRIVTNESLLLISLALIDPDPVSRIAGWSTPRRIDRGMYQAFEKRFPAINDIPDVGAVVPGKASLESILSARPDLFAVSLWAPGWEELTERLEAAGVPVLFLDGAENGKRGPGDASAFSIELLGRATGREDQAKAVAGFIRAHYRAVEERLKGVKEHPNVLIDAHAGTECCATPGAGNRMTEYLELAGGRSIAAGSIPGYDGRLNPEAVLTADPDVYIATGGPHLAAQGGLVIGGGLDAASARASLRDITQRSIRGELTAVRTGRAFAVSHQLSISALNVLVVECFAKWMHPTLFAGSDPADTLAEINRRFMAVPIEGTFWTSLNGEIPANR